MARYFSLALAEALLREIEPLVRSAVALKASYDRAERELSSISQRITMSGGAQVDRSEMLVIRGRFDAAGARLREILEEVQEHGCLVKDLDNGLLDFPTLYHGREVYLCWRLDEPGIHFWHPIEDGFRGRQPIDQEFRENHHGDRPH